MQIDQFTLPPEAILIRRMHGIVAVVLANLSARAPTGARSPRNTSRRANLDAAGEAEAAFLARHGRTTGAALAAADQPTRHLPTA